MIVGGAVGWAAPSIDVLVAARVLIGLGTSAAYPAGMALIRRRSLQLGQQTPGGVLGALAVTGQISMVVGPTLGGLLIMLGGWRLTFLVNVPLGVVCVLLALAWLGADEPVNDREPLWRALDPPGVALFAAALTALLVFLMNMADPRWWLLGLAGVLFAGLAVWELRVPAPFIDVRMLVRNRALTSTYLRYGTSMLLTYCFIYGWAIWLESSADRSASVTGLLMTPCFLVATVVSLFAARARQVWGPLATGAAVLVAGSVSLLVVDSAASTWQLLGIGVVFGVQNGLNVTTNQTAMYTQSPGDQTGTAAGLMRSFMYLGAITSASLIGLAFGSTATDHGLHTLATILTIGSTALLVTTLLDRTLRTGSQVAR